MPHRLLKKSEVDTVLELFEKIELPILRHDLDTLFREFEVRVQMFAAVAEPGLYLYVYEQANKILLRSGIPGEFRALPSPLN